MVAILVLPRRVCHESCSAYGNFYSGLVDVAAVEVALVGDGGDSGGAGTAEAVCYKIAGVAEHSHDTVEECEWLLGGVADSFPAGGADDADVPDVGEHPTTGMEACAVSDVGGGVAFTLNVERVVLFGGVPEERVVFGGEFPFPCPAAVVFPDDLVLEGGPTENPVEFYFQVVAGSRINVDNKIAVGHVAKVVNPGDEPVNVIFDAAVGVGVGGSGGCGAAGAAGVEWRVDVG